MRSDAEVAFVVADSWQGQGLGTVLFAGSPSAARAIGLERFVADTLLHNRRMLAVFHHAGLPVTEGVRDGVLHLVIELS